MERLETRARSPMDVEIRDLEIPNEWIRVSEGPPRVASRLLHASRNNRSSVG